MGSMIGIDMGATAVRVVRLEARLRSQVVSSVVERPLGPSGEGESFVSWADRTRAVLAELVTEGQLKGDTVVTCLPGAQVATHLVALPFGDLKRVEQALPFELEELIPFELDEVVYDWHVLSRTPQRTELLVGVARRDDVAQLLAVLNEAGVDPAVVAFSALTLSQLCSGWLGQPPAPATEPELLLPTAPDTVTDEPPPEAAPTQTASASPADAFLIEAIVDLGDSRTNLLIVQNGTVQFARTLSFSGFEVTAAVAAASGSTVDEAKAAKELLNLDFPSDATVSMAAEQAIGRLLRELRTTFAAHRARTRQNISRLRLCGGGAALAGLETYLASTLNLPVSALTLDASRKLPEGFETGRHALPLALALRGLEGNRPGRFNLRKGPFAQAQAGSGWRERRRPLLAMAAVLTLLFGAQSWMRLDALQRREAALDAALCETTKKILGKCETDYRVALGKLKGKGSPAASIPAVSALDLSEIISGLFPEGDDAVLTDLEIIDTTVSLRGDARSYEAVDKLVESMQREKCFTDIRKGNMTKGRGDRIEFKMDAKWGCTGRKGGS